MYIVWRDRRCTLLQILTRLSTAFGIVGVSVILVELIELKDVFDATEEGGDALVGFARYNIKKAPVAG
jgi:hypothetical protein